jgi:hypothetical protein
MGAAFYLVVGAVVSDGLSALMGAVMPRIAAPGAAARRRPC